MSDRFYGLRRVGTWQKAAIYVSFAETRYTRSRKNNDYAEQFSLSEQYLEETRKRGFTNAGLTCDGHYTSDDGREFWLFLEVSNQAYLMSFVPERDCVVEFRLCGDVEDISRYRKDLYSMLNSYEFQ